MTLSCHHTRSVLAQLGRGSVNNLLLGITAVQEEQPPINSTSIAPHPSYHPSISDRHNDFAGKEVPGALRYVDSAGNPLPADCDANDHIARPMAPFLVAGKPLEIGICDTALLYIYLWF